MDEERVFLTSDEAITMLPEKECIHTIRNAWFGIIGADCSREYIVEIVKKYQPELAGEVAANMNHKIVIFDETGPLFIETKPEDRNG